ncbi:hypothetical protein [Streptomyces sp. NPDC005859]|uniref:hypothetical protein n=1 Tax=Streptomyces sp. NPDC005859 TaxID=3157170 RepID=UPI0033C7ACCD
MAGVPGAQLAKAKNAPTMAAASNHSAFNLANAGGAWLGGLAVSAGWGWASPALVGAALAAAGLGLAFLGGLMDRGNGGSEVITASSEAEAPDAVRLPAPAGRRSSRARAAGHSGA